MLEAWVDAKGGRPKLLKDLESDEQLHVEWSTKVDEHEATRGQGKYSRQDTSVEAFATDEIESRTRKGVFWPVKVWQRENPDEDVKSCGHKFQQWQGKRGFIIPFDPTKPLPMGCEELWHSVKRGVTKKIELANSGDGDVDVDKLFQVVFYIFLLVGAAWFWK